MNNTKLTKPSNKFLKSDTMIFNVPIVESKFVVNYKTQLSSKSNILRFITVISLTGDYDDTFDYIKNTDNTKYNKNTNIAIKIARHIGDKVIEIYYPKYKRLTEDDLDIKLNNNKNICIDVKYQKGE